MSPVGLDVLPGELLLTAEPSIAAELARAERELHDKFLDQVLAYWNMAQDIKENPHTPEAQAVLAAYNNKPNSQVTDKQLLTIFRQEKEQAARNNDKIAADAARKAEQADHVVVLAEADTTFNTTRSRVKKMQDIATAADELSKLVKDKIPNVPGELTFDGRVYGLVEKILDIACSSKSQLSDEPCPSQPDATVKSENIVSTAPPVLSRQTISAIPNHAYGTPRPSSAAPRRPARTTEKILPKPVVESIDSALPVFEELGAVEQTQIAEIIKNQSDPTVVKNAVRAATRIMAVLAERSAARDYGSNSLRDPFIDIPITGSRGRQAILSALVIGGLSAGMVTVEDQMSHGNHRRPDASLVVSVHGNLREVSLASVIDPPHTVAAESNATDVLNQWSKTLKLAATNKPPLSVIHKDPETRQLLDFVATATQLRQNRVAPNLQTHVAEYGQTQINILKLVALHPDLFSKEQLTVLAATDNAFQKQEAANLAIVIFHNNTTLDPSQVSALLGVMAKWEDAVTAPAQKQQLLIESDKAAQEVMRTASPAPSPGSQPTAEPSAPGSSPPKTTPPPALPAIPPRLPNSSLSPAPEVGSSGEFDPSKYQGISFTHEDLARLASYWPDYTEAEHMTGIPREFLATLHKREHNLEMSNPNNGQGVYQFFSEAGMYPPGPISHDEFRRQTILAAQRIRDDYAKRGMKDISLNNEHIDMQKVMDTFLRYNGAPDLYIRQAKAQGYSVRQAFMGSPYVVNLLTDEQDSSKNPHWLQYLSDGTNVGPANRQPGAWIIFKELLEDDGNDSKLTDPIDTPPTLNPVSTPPPVVTRPTLAPAPAPSQTPSPQPSTETSPSPEGTTDLGLATCYFSRVLADGSKEYFNEPTRLAAIQGFLSSSEESNPMSKFYVQGANGNVIVNANIVAQTKAMYDAAEADGVDLSADSSYRAHAHQAELANANSNRDEVAAEGESTHESGLAIDMNLGLPLVANNFTTSDGQKASEYNPRVATGNKVWEWLVINADRFGFKQYWNEPWHWQVTLVSLPAQQPVHGAQ